MSASTNTGGGGGGGFTKATTKTQTGDAETLLQEINLPDADGVYNVLGRIGVSKKDAADEYAAIKRFEKSIRKAGGSIQQIVDHSDSESFQDLVGGLFYDGDFSLKDGANGIGLYGDSPDTIQDETLNSTTDLSGIAGIPTSPNSQFFGGCDTDPSNGSVHYAFDDSDSSQVSYYPPGGPKEQIANERLANGKNIEIAVDSIGDIHALWSRKSDGALRYSKRSSGSWISPETVDSSTTTASLSLDIDENDAPHCSYRDDTNNNLKYANRTGGSWSNEIVDSSVLVFRNTNICVESSSEIGIGYDNEDNNNLSFASGSSGNFSTDTAVDTNIQEVQAISVGGKKSNGDWSIAHTDRLESELKVTTGTISGGFSTKANVASADSVTKEGVQHVQGVNYGTIIFSGNSGGSNPYDAIVYTNESGSWSKKSVIAELGDNWSAHRNDNYVTATDNGLGDTKIASIQVSEKLNTTLKFNTGAEVTNADA